MIDIVFSFSYVQLDLGVDIDDGPAYPTYDAYQVDEQSAFQEFEALPSEGNKIKRYAAGIALDLGQRIQENFRIICMYTEYNTHLLIQSSDGTK